jgi:hypothetical protein
VSIVAMLVSFCCSYEVLFAAITEHSITNIKTTIIMILTHLSVRLLQQHDPELVTMSSSIYWSTIGGRIAREIVIECHDPPHSSITQTDVVNARRVAAAALRQN